MRRRYFSPEYLQLRSHLQPNNNRQNGRLRWMGSQTRLHSSNQFQQQNQCTIGCYTYYPNKQIGSGYSSKVYKAKKQNDSTDYAIKIIQLKKYSNLNMQMLASQIQILKSLNHPNILKFYDMYKNQYQCYIVTEYCGDGDLLSHLGKKGRYAENQAISIITDIAEGYKYLCQNHIIHRDLKPANILKSGTRWKIADFGFAIRSQSEIKTKYNVGTPLYMPPQALIENTYSPKSDIFSIGIIFFELLTGYTPWESRTEKDLIKKMNIIPFKIPDKFPISHATKVILEAMCEVKIRKRMQVEQFIKFNFSKINQPNDNPQQKSTKNQKNLQNNLSSRSSSKNLQALPRLMRAMSSKSILSTKQDLDQRKVQFINNEILICQLHYCRFLYYLVRNGTHLLLDRKPKQKLTLVVFTHLLKLVKLISEPNINCLHLADWDQFKKSKKYLNTYLTIKQYALRYQKQYLTFLKNIDIVVLDEVNDLFLKIGKANVLSSDFYNKVIRLLLPMIRIFNHNLGKKLIKHNSQLDKQCSYSGQIQALKSVYKYYQLLEMSIAHYQDYQYFQANCSIKVHVDFKKSGATVQHFNDLRQELKNI